MIYLIDCKIMVEIEEYAIKLPSVLWKEIEIRLNMLVKMVNSNLKFTSILFKFLLNCFYPFLEWLFELILIKLEVKPFERFPVSDLITKKWPFEVSLVPINHLLLVSNVFDLDLLEEFVLNFSHFEVIRLVLRILSCPFNFIHLLFRLYVHLLNGWLQFMHFMVSSYCFFLVVFHYKLVLLVKIHVFHRRFHLHTLWFRLLRFT
jgi:hypothetical protein